MTIINQINPPLEYGDFSCSSGGPIRGREPGKSIRCGRESINQAHVSLLHHTVANTHCGRTCRPIALDNLGSRECDRYREHLRQITMPSRSRPMPTGANAGRPACVSAVEHARRDPDRPARHGTAAAMDVRNTGAAALRAQLTLNVADAARLPHCGRRGACPDVVETISVNCEPTLGMLLADWIDHPDESLEH
ncbi:hypothetical protein EVAR_91690_1 [Eumeta japonica]|uniref:Uncharacterized protein n=1 Tax=Eumeta variegata TaxID=151549 RepID=A0A4C1ZCI3_EUMVA|nr:hypothetical protein EVAR_91690_1 [Eumeta japonica]